MRRTSRITLIAALASATALVAAPAFANGGGQTVNMPPWNWYIAAGGGEWGVDETNYDIGILTRGDAWDGSTATFFDPDYVYVASAAEGVEPAIPAGIFPFACVTSTRTDSGDDQVVSCDQTITTPWGLSITSDVRVFAPGDLARMTFYITNTTSAPVALGYEYAWNYGESSGHVRSSQPDVVQDTDADEGNLGPGDVWSYNIGDGTLNAGVAWGIGGQPLLGPRVGHDGYDNAGVMLEISAGETIAAGETVAIAFFHKVQTPELELQQPEPNAAPADAEAADESGDDVAPMPVPAPASSHEAETPASFMAEFASFSGRLTRGIPADITVGNWQPTAAPDSELADTGAGIDEQLLVGGIAAALLGAGAALVAIRRVTVRAARR